MPGIPTASEVHTTDHASSLAIGRRRGFFDFYVLGATLPRVLVISAGRILGPSSLTTAELRVLRLLPTHLSFREIAGKLHVSANTIKTQAHAVYRKLDASSRTEAVAGARQVGLLDP